MSSWWWSGTFVASQEQKYLADIIVSLTEELTEKNLCYAPDAENEYQMAASSQRLVFVSPTENHWNSIIGATSKFRWSLFEKYRLSGFQIGGEDRSVLGEKAPYHWDIAIWRDGQLTDWLIRNPSHYFSEWSDKNTRKYLFRYLQEKLSGADLTQRSTASLLKTYRASLEAAPSGLFSLLNDGIDKQALDLWLASPFKAVMENSSKILRAPFMGSAYETFTIALYFDYVFKNVEFPNSYYPGFHPETWASSVSNRIKEFKPLLFQWSDKQNLSPLMDKYSNLFFWDG